jgi:uncharacterized lipoprotein YddW (UPF0748 family)
VDGPPAQARVAPPPSALERDRIGAPSGRTGMTAEPTEQAMRARPLLLLLSVLILLALPARGQAPGVQPPRPTPAGPPEAAPTLPRVQGEQAPPATPAVEGRGIWIEMKTLPANAEGIRKIVRQLARCNFNFLLVEVTYEGSTLFPGPYQDARFRGLDPLRILVDEAHKHHLEVHPWFWSLKQGRWLPNGHGGGPVIAAHPDWAAVNATGRKVSPGSSYYWLCPSKPASREFIVGQIVDVARRYPIDGVHLDYIRFERTIVKGAPPPYCFCESCRAEYQKAGGRDPISIAPYTPEFRAWYLWRENLVNSLVAEVAARVKEVRPSVLVSAAVYPDPYEARRYFSQNWTLWLANRWLDFVTPMLYREETGTFSRRVDRYVKDGVTAQGIVLPGVGVNEILNRIFSHDVLIRQVMAARESGMLGNVLFSFSVMNPYLEQFLINKVYARPAAVPFRNEAEAVRRLSDQAQGLVAHASGALESNWLMARAGDLAGVLRYRENAPPAQPASEPPIATPSRFQAVPRVHIPRLGAAPRIDGSLADPAWKNVPEIKLALNQNGGWADARTWAKVAADGRCLYVAFHCEDKALSTTVATAKREFRKAWMQDHVAVYIDPGPSRSQYLVLRLNPIGRVGLEKVPDARKRPPGVGTEESVPDKVHWKGAVRRGAAFWNAEFAIPIAEVMALHPHDHALGLNLVRAHRGGRNLHADEWITTYGSPYDPLRFAFAELP